MKKLSLFIFISLLVVFSFCSFASAKNIPDHPVIRPYPGSVLAKNMSSYSKFAEFEFVVPDKATKKNRKQKVQGKYWHLLWEVRKPNGAQVQDISRLEFVQNFKNAALQAGGEILFEDQLYLYFKIPKDTGGYTWCRIHPVPNLGQVYMDIIDEKAFEQSLVFGPAQLKAALDRDGKVLLYGIYFDTDKSTLKKESEKQLSHIVSLMLTYPKLRLEIQGHTDDQGKPDYNMNLSNARANTVRTYLTLFGIDDGRLAAKGYGETKPVASNANDQGRARNRRVELVKMK